MKKTVYLMRHGQTLFNETKKIQGWCDSPLTHLGIYQAKQAAEYFEDKQIMFDVAYTSTSQRAIDTLEIITTQPYIRMKELREWNFGSLEGESEELNPPLPYGEYFTSFGGESEVEVSQRIINTITKLVQNSEHTSILIVSHGAACAKFYQAFEQYALVKRDGRLQNCCILKFEYENNIFTLTDLWNKKITISE